MSTVNEKGIVLPVEEEVVKNSVEQEFEAEKEEKIAEQASEIRKAEQKAAKIPVSGRLKELMEEYNIPTFVSLAKVCLTAPQQLYSRKKTLEDGTKVYSYDAIERFLIKSALKNTEMTTIEEILEAAKTYLDNKAINREKKVSTPRKKKENKDIPDFKVGDKVEYDTYRANDGVREYYTRKGEIVEMMGTTKAKLKTDDGGDVEITLKKLRYQEEKEVAEA